MHRYSAVSYAVLGPRERSIVDAFAAGDVWSPGYFIEWVNKSSGPEREFVRTALAGQDPDEAVEVEAKKPVPATLIRQLLFKMVTDSQGYPITVDERGARMQDSLVHGELDLAVLEFRKPIVFKNCIFDSPISFRDAKLGRVSLDDSSVPSLESQMVDVDSDFSVVRLKDCQNVDLTRARIAGTLSLNGASLGNIDGMSLSCNGAHISGSIWMRKFKATGMVDLVRASISGRLDCTGGSFSEAPEGDGALFCTAATIGSDVFLCEGFTASGRVVFGDATIGGLLSCEAGEFDGHGSEALYCQRAKISASVFLRNGFKATGKVDFHSAKIGGQLSCEAGVFDAHGSSALDCENATIGADVFLRNGFKATGTVDFSGATIGGQLSCEAGVFDAHGSTALDCESATIGADVFLRYGFNATGTVNLIGATITGNVQLQNGAFFDGMNKGSTDWEPNRHEALDMEGAHVDGTLFLTKVKSFEGTLDLQDAYAIRIADDGSICTNRPSWLTRIWFKALARIGLARQALRQRKILLDRFCYDSFADDYDGPGTDLSTKARLAWLETQPDDWWGRDFRPQPFTHCAKVLRKMGYTKDARLVLFERERRRLKHRNVWRLERWIRAFFLGLFAGYGYKAHRAFVALFVVWLIGVGLFHLEGKMGLMRAASDNVLASDWYVSHNFQPPDYEPFKPWLYSLDVMLPIIDFHQKSAWVPDDARDRVPGFERILPPTPDEAWAHRLRGLLAWLPKGYYWFEIAMGWFLTTIIVAGFTGLLGNPREE